MTISINIDEELRVFAEEKARSEGYSTLEEYLAALLREAKDKAQSPPHPGASDSPHPAPWEVAVAIGAEIPLQEWEKVPTDLSKNVDHYLYGAPRETD